MAKKILIITLIMLLSAFTAFGKISKERTSILTYTTIIKDIPAEASEIKVWIPYPAQNYYQKVKSLNLDKEASSVKRDGNYDNRILFYKIKDSKKPSLRISQTYRIERREYSKMRKDIFLHAKEKAGIKKYLSQNKFVHITPEINDIALRITKNKKDDIEKAMAIYDYVLNTIAYDKTVPGWGEGNLDRICKVKKGNCTDFHSLFVALAMASGVPAKFVIGFTLPEKGQGRIDSYHCWAEFYAKDRGWVPVDVSTAWKNKEKSGYYFMSIDENRVEFTTGRGIVLKPPQNAEPLNYFIYPYVEIDGRKYEKVEAVIDFKNEKEI